VGLDFGSTTASAIVATAQLVRNCVTGRRELGEVEVQFCSDLVFTPFQGDSIDIERAEQHIDRWLARGKVDTREVFGGGALITGLAARQANAAALAESIRRRLGDTLIATADDPCLESWLAFMGSCRELSSGSPDMPFLNLDIGGGTTNLAWGQAGEVSRVGCYFVGARHVEVIPGTYQVIRLSPFSLRLFEELQIQARAGDVLSADDVAAILDFYVRALEAAILGNDDFLSREAMRLHQQVAFNPPQGETPVITLSGGVGELAYRHARGERLPATTAFGDLGIDFAKRICRSPLLAKDLKQFVPPNLGRATVVGLTMHNTEVSGSTLFLPRPAILPLSDLPIVGRLAVGATPEQVLSLLELARVATRGAGLHVDCPLADWQAIKALGQRLAAALEACDFPSDRPLVLFVAGNVGKTLGQYASRWGASNVNLVVIDEIPDRRAHFASVGRMCENAAPVSFYGLHRGDVSR
jgi:ethanolamine utilization protein EutA